MTNSLRIAYYCTSHGLGHATRVIEVCKALCAIKGHVTVVTCISAQVFRDDAKLEEFYQKQLFEVRNLEKPLDCGAIQSDALTVEPLETLDRYYNIAVTNRKQLLDTEVAWMKEARIQVVVSDVVPLACAAAAVLSIPSACLTNFSWDYVYADYLKRENPSKAHIDMVNTIKEDYSHAKVLIRLPGYSAMPAFKSIVDIPFVVRHAQNTREAVRRQYGIKKDTKLLLLMFGGQPGGHEWPFPIDAIPPGWTCAACHAAWPQSPRKGASVSKDFVHLPSNTYLPDIIAASDCILGKIGYGCVSEVMVHKVPLVFITRKNFNEEIALRKMLEQHNNAIEMDMHDFYAGSWKEYILKASKLKPNFEGHSDGAQKAAQVIMNLREE